MCVALKNVVVRAALAAFPKGFVLRKLREGDRAIAQFIVDLHHCQAGGDSKKAGAGILFLRELKYFFL